MNRDNQLIFEAYEDGPAVEQANGTKVWYVNNKLHRIDGPAVEYADGSKEWYVNDQHHRIDGPAVEYSDGTKEWFVNGKCHRLDGPAYDGRDGVKEWYINGKRFHTPGEWAEAVLKIHNEPSDPRSVDNFLRPILTKYMDDLL